MQSRSFVDKLQSIDRRWIFLLIALAVIIPSAFRIAFKEPATPEVEAIFDRIESLPERSNVLISFDFDPPSEPELLPMAYSLMRHMALNNLRIYMIALWPMGHTEAKIPAADLFGYGVTNLCPTSGVNGSAPTGAGEGTGATAQADCVTPEFPNYRYGEDFVMLGYQPGGAGVIRVILNEFRGLYTTDAANTPVDSIPMMREVENLQDMSLLVNLAAGDTNKYWVLFAGDPGHIPVAAGVTAVSAPGVYPYYPRQMFGILGGLKAAAEYESLLVDRYRNERCGDATYYSENEEVCSNQLPNTADFGAMRRMGPQTFAHLTIILFILIGNIAYFLTRRGKSQGVTRTKAE